MVDLARRLEAAETGSDALDAEIAILSGWTHRPDGMGRWDLWFAPGEASTERHAPPKHTRSIDDALLSLPKSYSIESIQISHAGSSTYLIYIHAWRNGYILAFMSRGAKSIPLGICAAIQRARHDLVKDAAQ